MFFYSCSMPLWTTFLMGRCTVSVVLVADIEDVQYFIQKGRVNNIPLMLKLYCSHDINMKLRYFLQSLPLYHILKISNLPMLTSLDHLPSAFFFKAAFFIFFMKRDFSAQIDLRRETHFLLSPFVLIDGHTMPLNNL